MLPPSYKNPSKEARNRLKLPSNPSHQFPNNMPGSLAALFINRVPKRFTAQHKYADPTILPGTYTAETGIRALVTSPPELLYETHETMVSSQHYKNPASQ